MSFDGCDFIIAATVLGVGSDFLLAKAYLFPSFPVESPQAEEVREVPADLLPEFQSGLKASRAKPPDQSYARPVRDIAERLGIPVDQLEQGLAVLESQPLVVRALVMRWIAEAWLEGQRETYPEQQARG